MRSSLLLLAASVVSASILPRAAPALPASAFTPIHAIPFEEAKALKEAKDANATHQRINNKVGIQAVSAAGDVQALAGCTADQNIRIEWRSYPREDRLAFVGAIKCLLNKAPSGNFAPAKNRYEDLVRLHQLNTPNIHQNSKFLLWHRYFVWTFEQVLRAECGFDRRMPWWDETLDSGNFAQSDLFTNNDYFGHLPSVPNCIVSGAFNGLTCNIGPGPDNIPHCLTRSVNEGLTGQVNSGYVNLCNSYGNYADMAGCLEGGPHAYGHNGIGSVMSNPYSSPGDPIFFMHHLFVDRNFRIWQNGNVAVRTTTINGADINGTPLSLDTPIYMGGIRPNIRVRDILNTLGGVDIGGTAFCYRYNY